MESCDFWAYFRPRAVPPIIRGVSVIARTDRGLEQGEILCEATPEALAALHEPTQGQILRPMTVDDHHESARIRGQAPQQHATCERYIEKLALAMQLVDVEQLFGGERLVVYYLAENRVDFRELVRQLAGEFQTRIEMRQIGVRDEAKLLADYGDCGVPVCCNNHLVEMPPVSMRMAKLQKATLDPTKISGRCGRLKCCLRYEYENYEHPAKEPVAAPPAAEAGTVADGDNRHGETAGREQVPRETTSDETADGETPGRGDVLAGAVTPRDLPRQP